jgi:hypothetical protein
MSQLFKEKTGKFGSLISLIALSAMFVVFWLAVPEFLTSQAGRIFAVVWAIAVIAAFIVHARRLSGEPRRYSMLRREKQKKDVRTRKTVRTKGMMRG